MIGIFPIALPLLSVKLPFPVTGCTFLLVLIRILSISDANINILVQAMQLIIFNLGERSDDARINEFSMRGMADSY